MLGDGINIGRRIKFLHITLFYQARYVGFPSLLLYNGRLIESVAKNHQLESFFLHRFVFPMKVICGHGIITYIICTMCPYLHLLDIIGDYNACWFPAIYDPLIHVTATALLILPIFLSCVRHSDSLAAHCKVGLFSLSRYLKYKLQIVCVIMFFN